MGGSSSKYKKSHGMSGKGKRQRSSKGSAAAKATPAVQAVAAPAPPKPKQTREQQLLAKIKGNPAALMQMSDQDAADTVAVLEKQAIASDGSQRDCFIQRYMAALGWATNKPEVLTDTAYERARKKAGAESMYHSDDASNATQGRAFNQQLLSGDVPYYSEGVHGAGTYWAHASAGASGGYGAYQCKAFLNSKAKMVTNYQLRQDFAQLSKKKPKLFAALKNAKRGDYGGYAETFYPVLAAARGCNVILDVGINHTTSTKRSQGQYVVTLDRSALTMSRKTISNASNYMANW